MHFQEACDKAIKDGVKIRGKGLGRECCNALGQRKEMFHA